MNLCHDFSCESTMTIFSNAFSVVDEKSCKGGLGYSGGGGPLRWWISGGSKHDWVGDEFKIQSDLCAVSYLLITTHSDADL